MSTPVVTDVFKFLAIRAVQRVTEKETARTFVRDPRAATAAGTQGLKVLAQKLAQPNDVALESWQKLDLSLITPLAEGYRELTRLYEHVSPGEDVPEAMTLMAEAGLANVGDGRSTKLTQAAWEALYTAHATGPGAGPLLETPMAALRVLHFAQSLRDDPRPSPSAALEALRATVAIPAAFDDAFHPPSPAPTKSPPNAGSDSLPSTETSVRSRLLRALALDLNVTERLLETVTNASVLPSPVTRQGTLEPSPGWSGRFSLSTVPLLSDALPAQLSRDEAGVLDQLRLVETTPAPVAAQTLQAHLQKLNDQASLLADDPEFQTALNEIARTLNPILIPFVKTLPPEPAADVDVSGRITPLGIGDLKVVKQTLLAYVAGEVAHIENVLQGESKERTHRKLDRTETTIFTSEEETKDTERDTQSTDRFELKREAENSLKEDMSVKAGLTVTASYGPVVATATGDFAYSTSKQSSEKTSSNFAHEVVDRSITKVQTKTKTERTTKTLNEVEEVNRHVLNNGPPSAGNITGIYRWVDKRYRAQVYNYGVRLLLEFIIPEPAAFYRATHTGNAPKVNAKPPWPFIKDPPALGRVGGPVAPVLPLTAEHITEFNYFRYAARYGAAGVLPPPPLFTYIGTSLVKEDLEAGKVIGMASDKFLVPAGYKLSSYSATVTILSIVGAPKFSLQIGSQILPPSQCTKPG